MRRELRWRNAPKVSRRCVRKSPFTGRISIETLSLNRESLKNRILSIECTFLSLSFLLRVLGVSRARERKIFVFVGVLKLKREEYQRQLDRLNGRDSRFYLDISVSPKTVPSLRGQLQRPRWRLRSTLNPVKPELRSCRIRKSKWCSLMAIDETPRLSV